MYRDRVGYPQYSSEYQDYQEKLAFEKELNILRNDFYYKMQEGEETLFIDFLYQPLDILSGDAYSARVIDKNRSFYLLVDGMGKGISASLSAILITSFINYHIDRMIRENSFSLHALIKESIEYLRPILLDEEIICLDFILFNNSTMTLDYAKFSTPPFLLEDKDNNIIRLKSNNAPISKWSKSFNIDSFDIRNISKFLFFSDGIVENNTLENIPYSKFIEKDFSNSFTREEMVRNIFSRISKQEDDFALIFINKVKLNSKNLLYKREFNSTLESIDDANIWYESLYDKDNISSIAFNELIMNAYEHGNLSIDSKDKNRLVEEDRYIDELLGLEKENNKKIMVKVYEIKYMEKRYRIVEITDEGDGFDSNILSIIFRNSKKFNGRGVYVSRKNTMGIYYNKKGNSVFFIV